MHTRALPSHPTHVCHTSPHPSHLPPPTQVADLDRLQRRRSLGIDTGVDLAALDPTLVTDMQGDVAPAALHAPSPIRLKVAEGLVPGRDAMPGDSDDEIMEEEKAQGWQGTQGPDSGRVTPSPHRPQLRSDASGRRHPDRSVANSLSGIRRVRGVAGVMVLCLCYWRAVHGLLLRNHYTRPEHAYARTLAPTPPAFACMHLPCP